MSAPIGSSRHWRQRPGVLSEFNRKYLRSTAEQHRISGGLFQLSTFLIPRYARPRTVAGRAVQAAFAAARVLIPLLRLGDKRQDRPMTV
jgi:hypothetical protein